MKKSLILPFGSRRLLCVSLTGLALAGAMARVADAQARPDFSGRWTVAPDTVVAGGGRQGGPAPTMGSGWGNEITLAQTATQLTLEYLFFARSDLQPPHKFVFALDGSESKTTLMLGRGADVFLSRATWDGNQLRIVTTQRIADPVNVKATIQTEVTRTLSLDAPAVLRVVTVRNAPKGGAPTTTTTLYRKQ